MNTKIMVTMHIQPTLVQIIYQSNISYNPFISSSLYRCFKITKENNLEGIHWEEEEVE